MVDLTYLLTCSDEIIVRQVSKTMDIFKEKFKACKDFKMFIVVGDEKYELEYIHNASLCYIWGNAINERCDAQDILLKMLMIIKLQKKLLCT